MKELTHSQKQVRDTYIKHKNASKVAEVLDMQISSVLKALGSCAINLGVFDADYANSFSLPGAVTDRATTHVRFDKDGKEVRNIWYKEKFPNSNIDIIIDALKERIPVNMSNIAPPTKFEKNTMLEINLADMHIGVMCWKEETGDRNFNLGIAKTLYLQSVRETLERTGKVGLIRLVLLGDITHSDGLEAFTPESHHVLDVDSRWDKILKSTIDIIVSAVELSSSYAKKVEVYTLRGNHDKNASIGLRHILGAYFRSSKNITIDMSPSKMRCCVFGSSASAYVHGDRTNINRVASDLLTWIARNDVVGVRDFYVTQGHLHKEEVHDVNGVRCEIMPTLMAKDAFASCGNWSSKRALISRIFDKERGLLQSIIVTPRQLGL